MKRKSADVQNLPVLLKKQLMNTLLLTAALVSFTGNANADANRIEQYFNQVDTQAYQGNYSVISQIGNNNRADVKQSYSAAYQSGNFSNIAQRGNGNTASITQAGGKNYGVILQAGNHHIANINQSGSQQELATYVSQTGLRSDIQVSQSGSGYRNIGIEQQAFSGYTRPVTVETY
ncbi:hypothetical protein [Vreelandella zhanjiangensis]|uniref:hypothetical protein n=1 Tax=Vreelandella zhanjiangensis TaxID=1121960 RepID=UPI0003773ADF|nr:hypothetical protein [Halomonas zhanjiangensis]